MQDRNSPEYQEQVRGVSIIIRLLCFIVIATTAVWVLTMPTCRRLEAGRDQVRQSEGR